MLEMKRHTLSTTQDWRKSPNSARLKAFLRRQQLSSKCWAVVQWPFIIQSTNWSREPSEAESCSLCIKIRSPAHGNWAWGFSPVTPRGGGALVSGRKKGVLFFTQKEEFLQRTEREKKILKSHCFANMRHNGFWKLKQRLKQKFSTGTLSLAFFSIIFIFGTTRLLQGRNGKSHCQAI